MATATTGPRLHGKGAKIPRQSREDLLMGVQSAASEKGERLSVNDFHRRKFDLMPVGHYVREFGSVTEAIDLAAETSPIEAERTKQERYVDPVLAEAMEAAASKDGKLRGSVTVSRQGVESTINADDLTDIVKFARFLGDDATADILNQWRMVTSEMPEGFTYGYTAQLGDTKISLSAG